MKKTYQRRQIKTTTPDGQPVVLYRLIDKYTGQPFYSTNRRATYAPGSLELKQKQDEEAKQARRNVCKVYFYQCPISGRWFTTQKAGSRYSPESKTITHQKELDCARQHRQQPHVKEWEANRRNDPARREYLRQYYRRGKPVKEVGKTQAM